MSSLLNEAEKCEVSELDGSNYSPWKYKGTMVQDHKGLWGSVGGSGTDEHNAKKSLALIGLSVKHSQIVLVMDCATVREAWRNLSNFYENSGLANKMHSTEELMTAKMADEDKVHTHAERLRSIFSKLGTINAAASDKQYKIALLQSLSKSYESVVVALENLIHTLSIEYIHASITREESRKPKCNDGDDANYGDER